LYLAAEIAEELSVLRDFHLFDGLTERSAIARSVFAYNTSLLSALGLKVKKKTSIMRIHKGWRTMGELLG